MYPQDLDLSRPRGYAVAVTDAHVHYGTDFPNIPYEWDRELEGLRGLGTARARLA